MLSCEQSIDVATEASLRLRSVSVSHVGHVRSFNEDRVFERADLGLFAVADGMGGHRGGDVAADMAVRALSALATSGPVDSSAVVAALIDINAKIYSYANKQQSTVGATIVAACIQDQQADICWAGDSRAYLVNDEGCRRLTTDHSIVQELVDAGAIEPCAAVSHPQAHVITRALGVSPSIQLDTITVTFGKRDRLLICSDGLSRAVDLGSVTANLSADHYGANYLLAEALRVDGSDNISFVLIDARS